MVGESLIVPVTGRSRRQRSADSTRRAQSEYCKQLSVYYHVLAWWFTEKDVPTSLFNTSEGTNERIVPLSLEELRGII